MNIFSDIDNLFSIGIFFVFIIIIICIFLLSIIVIYLWGKYNLYKKAHKNGWEALIPFYSDYIYVSISSLNWWWFILLIANKLGDYLNFLVIIPIVSLLAKFCCNYNISKKLHCDCCLAVLMTLFPFIIIPLIGLSNKYVWDDDVIVSNNGIFKNTSNTSTNKYCSNCGNTKNMNDKFCSNCGHER